MKEKCLFWRTFFGRTYDFMHLPTEYINALYEKIYYMKTYMNWSFEEVYILPIVLRNWFFQKWIEEKSKNLERE